MKISNPKNIYDHPIMVLLIVGIFITSLGLMFISDMEGFMFSYGMSIFVMIFSAVWIIAYGIPILWNKRKK